MPNPRAVYSPIFDRPPLLLPDGARVAVWFIINVEEWDIAQPMARSVLPAPQGAAVSPDIPNYSWFDYGLRVGFWRLQQALDAHGLPATVSINAAVCEHYPQLAQSCLERGWELMGHGYIQQVLHQEPDERAAIRKTIRVIREFSGGAPRGWMGPGLAETWHTPDILAEEGIEYVADWVNDDQPYDLQVAAGRLVAIPYTVELNDIPIYLVQHHSAPELYRRAKDALETLLDEGEQSARIMAVSLHPYITGAAHRIGHFRRLLEHLTRQDGVTFWTGSGILDWYCAQTRTGP